MPAPSLPETASQPGRPRFIGLLPDLVAVGLFRPARDALARGDAEVPAPLVDRAYLLKILDEEMARPFGHPLRPIVELCLNAADAVAPGAAVDVSAADGFVEVSDRGEGMSISAILSRLLLPFATD